jgi:16S rRNA (adenine1518-N6/adenine1519-N6)-dimethyltransferase
MEIKHILQQNNFRFNKQFGQNFLTDDTLLANIAIDAGVDGGTVLEIGAGAGTLTKALAKVADNVITFEVDRNLEKVLATTLADCNNVKVVMGDVMKYKMADIEALCGAEYRLVANIPYYITTPLLMRFVEDGQNVTSITLTIQKEVAERLASKPATKDYGAITVTVQAVADVTITRILPRELFYPVPNVDSAVVRIDLRKDKFDIADHDFFRKVVKISFAMRRKTLVNNLMVGFKMDRQTAETVLAECDLTPNCRGEELSVEKFVQLYKVLQQKGIK